MFDYTILYFLKTIVSIFVGILFTQSGLDKVVDFKNNLGYIKSVFEKTFLKDLAPLLLIIITIMEVIAGSMCLLGAWYLFLKAPNNFSVMGLQLAALSLLLLFTGQRIAKDYAGAASLVNYFVLIVLGLFLFSLK
jgi:putative oxidoreductase